MGSHILNKHVPRHIWKWYLNKSMKRHLLPDVVHCSTASGSMMLPLAFGALEPMLKSLCWPGRPGSWSLRLLLFGISANYTPPLIFHYSLLCSFCFLLLSPLLCPLTLFSLCIWHPLRTRKYKHPARVFKWWMLDSLNETSCHTDRLRLRLWVGWLGLDWGYLYLQN